MSRKAKIRPPLPARSNREAGIFLLLFLLGFLPYANTLFSGFVYDDNFQVVESPYVHSFRYLREIFTTNVWSFQGASGFTNYFRPMMTLGYLLTYQIAGLVPFSFHLINIILNCAAVMLVFLFLRRFSGERVALVATGLFALHPIHTEAVAWIAAVTDLQLAVCYLATFLFFLKLEEPAHKARTTFLMCGVYLLALLSKEQAMTLPVMATIFEYFYRDSRKESNWRVKLSRVGPLWGVAAVYLIVRISILGGVAGVLIRPNLSWHDTILSAVSLIGGYIGKLFWPVHFSAFYLFRASRTLTDPRVLAGLAGIALGGLLFLYLWKRQHLLSFSFFVIFLPLGPVLNARWMPASVFAERYIYLPSIGFCWLLGWYAVRIWNSEVPHVPRPLVRAVPVLIGVIAIAYAARTVTRNRDWRSEEALFRQTVASQSDASLVRADLGAVFYNQRKFDAAGHEWLVALASGATNAFALDNMALLRQHEGRYIEAEEFSRRALRARPEFMTAHLTLAKTLALEGRSDEAEWQFRIATTLTPLSVRAHNEFGKFLLDKGRTEDARLEYERSVAVDVSTEAYDQLGKIYLAMQDTPHAERAFRSALEADSFDSEARFGLGHVLEIKGQPADALKEYEKGLEMDPSDPEAKAAVVRLRRNTAINSSKS